MKMSGESPYHTMSEGELVMDVDSDLSLYHQVELPTAAGLKPGLELPVPAPVGEEVVITDCGVPTSGIPSPAPAHSQILEDQAVEEFMVELPLDDPEDGDYSMDSQQETAAAHHSPVYTMLEPATAGCTGPWSLGASCDSDSLDSGLGSSEKSSILSKKNSLSRLPSQDDESADLSSWTQFHPTNWTSREVLDWIYHLAEQDNTNIDESQLRGEAFHVDGPTLCSWTKADFIKADPRHGVDICENFQALLGSGDFIAPDEVSEGTGWDRQPFDNPLVREMEDGSSPIRSEIDPYLPQNIGSSILISGQPYTIDPRDDFGDLGESVTLEQSLVPPVPGMHASIKHCNGGGLVRQMAEAVGERATAFMNNAIMSQCHANLSPPAHVNDVTTHSPAHTPIPSPTHTRTAPMKRGRGRPPKPRPAQFDGSDSEYTPYKTPKVGGSRGGPRGKRTHSNRMLHLWEFIRDLLLDPKTNPTLIRWENRREGVFRVIRSKEVARMWGVRKQNPDMTYEKFSRSMRFCRTAEYFSEVPKDGKYPKKLCFAFGPRAHGWQPNSVISHCYYKV